MKKLKLVLATMLLAIGSIQAQDSTIVQKETALAFKEFVNKNYEDAYNILIKNSTSVEFTGLAQNVLGVMYKIGTGVEKNLDEAFKWYKKSAEQGNSIGQYNLGSAYKNGEGVENNVDEALKWYTKSAEQGNADAQSDLGLLYTTGEGVKKDFAIALNWYTKSANQNNSTAQYNLG